MKDATWTCVICRETHPFDHEGAFAMACCGCAHYLHNIKDKLEQLQASETEALERIAELEDEVAHSRSIGSRASPLICKCDRCGVTIGIFYLPSDGKEALCQRCVSQVVNEVFSYK